MYDNYTIRIIIITSNLHAKTVHGRWDGDFYRYKRIIMVVNQVVLETVIPFNVAWEAV